MKIFFIFLKKFFISLIVSLTIPFSVKAELTSDMVKAAQQKYFVLCGLEDGLDKKRLEREMTFILQENGIDYLINNKTVNDRAQTLYEVNGCDLFPKTYLLDWVKELQSTGENIYEKSNKTEQKLMAKMGITTCKFNQNLITLKERNEEFNNFIMDINSSKIDENLFTQYVEGAIWYAAANLDQECELR